jgi:hypothetical protein
MMLRRRFSSATDKDLIEQQTNTEPEMKLTFFIMQNQFTDQSPKDNASMEVSHGPPLNGTADGSIFSRGPCLAAFSIPPRGDSGDELPRTAAPGGIRIDSIEA